MKRAYVHLFSCLCCCCFCWWCCTVFSLAGATLHQFRMLNTPKHFAKRLLESFIHPFNTMYARTIEHPIQRTHAGMPHERIWNTDTVQVANMEFVNENFSHTHTHTRLKRCEFSTHLWGYTRSVCNPTPKDCIFKPWKNIYWPLRNLNDHSIWPLRLGII